MTVVDQPIVHQLNFGDFQLNRLDTENISPNQYLYRHPSMNEVMVPLLQFSLYCCLQPSHSFCLDIF